MITINPVQPKQKKEPNKTIAADEVTLLKAKKYKTITIYDPKNNIKSNFGKRLEQSNLKDPISYKNISKNGLKIGLQH